MKEIWLDISAEVQPATDNIRERVLIATLATKCASDFRFLINVRANADEEAKDGCLWAFGWNYVGTIDNTEANVARKALGNSRVIMERP